MRNNIKAFGFLFGGALCGCMHNDTSMHNVSIEYRAIAPSGELVRNAVAFAAEQGSSYVIINGATVIIESSAIRKVLNSDKEVVGKSMVALNHIILSHGCIRRDGVYLLNTYIGGVDFLSVVSLLDGAEVLLINYESSTPAISFIPSTSIQRFKLDGPISCNTLTTRSPASPR